MKDSKKLDLIKQGKQHKDDYLMVVCDTFKYSYYPVFCSKDDLPLKKVKYSQNMQKIMDIFNLSYTYVLQSDRLFVSKGDGYRPVGNSIFQGVFDCE